MRGVVGGVVVAACSLLAGCGSSGAPSIAAKPTTPPATVPPTVSPRQAVINAVVAYREARSTAFGQGYDDSALQQTSTGLALEAAECILKTKSDSLENTHAYFTFQPVLDTVRQVSVQGNQATVVRDEHQVVTLHRADGSTAVNDDAYTQTYDLRDDGTGWQVVDYSWTTPDGSTGGAVTDDAPCTSAAQTPTPTPPSGATPTPTPAADTPTPTPGPQSTPTPTPVPATKHDYQVADYTEQGVRLDVIFMGDAYGKAPLSDQRQIWFLLQTCASDAGLKGTVVPAWQTSDGSTGYLAQKNWQPYFSSVSWDDLTAKINEKLTCTF